MDGVEDQRSEGISHRTKTRVEGSLAKKNSGQWAERMNGAEGGVVGLKGRIEGVEKWDVARIFCLKGAFVPLQLAK